MKIPQQIQHFEKYRQLRDVPKQPLQEDGAIPDGLWVRAQVDDLFQSTRGLDNDARDYDPRQGQILRWSQGTATSAAVQSDEQTRNLDRTDVTAYRRDIYRVRQDPHSIDFLDALVERDGYSQLQCWHLDLKNWDASFYQCL